MNFQYPLYPNQIYNPQQNIHKQFANIGNPQQIDYTKTKL